MMSDLRDKLDEQFYRLLNTDRPATATEAGEFVDEVRAKVLAVLREHGTTVNTGMWRGGDRGLEGRWFSLIDLGGDGE
jgi:hypothetical protein